VGNPRKLSQSNHQHKWCKYATLIIILESINFILPIEYLTVWKWVCELTNTIFHITSLGCEGKFSKTTCIFRIQTKCFRNFSLFLFEEQRAEGVSTTVFFWYRRRCVADVLRTRGRNTHTQKNQIERTHQKQHKSANKIAKNVRAVSKMKSYFGLRAEWFLSLCRW
jgi:hypothetical protein